MIRVQSVAQPVVPDPKGRVKQEQRVTQPVRQPPKECKTTAPGTVKRKTVSVTLRVDVDLCARLGEEAKRRKLNRSQTIVAMLKERLP